MSSSSEEAPQVIHNDIIPFDAPREAACVHPLRRASHDTTRERQQPRDSQNANSRESIIYTVDMSGDPSVHQASFAHVDPEENVIEDSIPRTYLSLESQSGVFTKPLPRLSGRVRFAQGDSEENSIRSIRYPESLPHASNPNAVYEEDPYAPFITAGSYSKAVRESKPSVPFSTSGSDFKPVYEEDPYGPLITSGPYSKPVHKSYAPSSTSSSRMPSERMAPASLPESEIEGPPEMFIMDDMDGGHDPRIAKGLTAWDLYNDEARKVDNELVKDWRDSLNSLLVFAAIFAAVLTAFIIESMKLLEPDQTEVLVDIALLYLNNAGNISNTVFARPEFTPDVTAISINCLLFGSLGASLVAALASVVALQWVADYDSATSRGGALPEDRAKRRQFRYAGVVSWKMGEIIASLPLLLYSSVVLFWAGAIQWTSTLYPTVGYIVAGGTAAAVLFYLFTTFLASVYVSAPFRTPLSRGVYWASHTTLSSSYQLILFLKVPQALRSLGRRILTFLPWSALVIGTISSAILYTLIILAFCLVILAFGPLITLAFIVTGYRSHAIFDTLSVIPPPPWIKAIRRFRIPAIRLSWIKAIRLSWILDHFLPRRTSRQREDDAAAEYSIAREEALSWLAHQLNVSIDSYPRLLLLLREVVNLSSKSFAHSFRDAPWQIILDSLALHYMRKIFLGTSSESDYEAIDTLLRCTSISALAAQISPSTSYNRNHQDDNYWTQFCFTTGQLMNPQFVMSESMAHLFIRDVPTRISRSKPELKSTIQLIKWRNSAGIKRADVWLDIFCHPHLYSLPYLDLCMKRLEEVIEFMNQQNRYMSVYEPLWLFAKGQTEAREQVVHSLQAVDNMLHWGTSTIYPNYHAHLVFLMCQDLIFNSYSWPCLSIRPGDLEERVGNLQDPCLALVGGHVCGLSISIENMLTPSHINEYSPSFRTVVNLLARTVFENAEQLVCIAPGCSSVSHFSS
ncbi:hypothetical protein M408DRAFT_182846 [Serendipita vermifera MAFF 305830]|uniref:DUF6535 domain-containing protein n=1 Tax=Serendipita vermifera MAFF 305830 TaxID=933852 RepID=A0A0C3AK80_SERVB|nr:hypothetical protein M408DRAFT_182846 [Serendipita vermifera MAFF 305830]